LWLLCLGSEIYFPKVLLNSIPNYTNLFSLNSWQLVFCLFLAIYSHFHGRLDFGIVIDSKLRERLGLLATLELVMLPCFHYVLIMILLQLAERLSQYLDILDHVCILDSITGHVRNIHDRVEALVLQSECRHCV
jgi:hypothetical protein